MAVISAYTNRFSKHRQRVTRTVWSSRLPCLTYLMDFPEIA
jgi:hypothetical protein